MHEWLPPMPSKAEYDLTKHALHCQVQLKAKRFFTGNHRRFLQSMESANLACRLINSDKEDRNPYNVVAGGTDLETKLREQSQVQGHLFSIRMAYRRQVRPFLCDAGESLITESTEFDPQFVRQVVNTLNPTELRVAVATILVNEYLGADVLQEIDTETLETNTRPTWREGADLAWIEYEMHKVKEVFQEICEGNFTYYEKDKG